MAETPSSMQPLGTALPTFALQDVCQDRLLDQSYLAEAQASVVMFICNHCPYVQRILPDFKRLESDYTARGVKIVAINSNDISSYPQDGPINMRQLAKQQGWNFPFLLDDSQRVAKAFGATCTPDFFVYDAQQKLAYRGQWDAARPSNDTPTSGKDIRQALDALLRNQPATTQQIPSVGCNIKWKR